MRASTFSALLAIADLACGLRTIGQMQQAHDFTRLLQLQTYAQFWFGAAFMSAIFMVFAFSKERR